MANDKWESSSSISEDRDLSIKDDTLENNGGFVSRIGNSIKCENIKSDFKRKIDRFLKKFS